MNATTFRKDIKPVWCAGCGDYAVLQALTKSLDQMGLAPHQVAVIGGIGCSSRLPGYVNAYGLNSLHGRGIPLARGVKMGRSELTVVSVGGDGDLFSIGGEYLTHIVRSNLDITVICLDNFVYGLTKGQASPTTTLGMGANPTNGVSPIHPVFTMLSAGVDERLCFVAQGISSNPKQLQDLIVQAVRHPGFSFINVLTSCTTYRKAEFDALKARCVPVPETHDAGDYPAALLLSMTKIADSPHIGVFYRGRVI